MPVGYLGKGSWFGLPDFGITETLFPARQNPGWTVNPTETARLANERNSGTSTLNLPQTINYAKTGSVLGANSLNPGQVDPGIVNGGNTGGSGGGSQPAPAGGGGDANARLEAERQARIQRNQEVLNNVLAYVGGGRGRAQSALEQALQGIEGFRSRSRGASDEALKQIQGQYGEAEQQNTETSSRMMGEGARTFEDLYARSGNRLNKMGLSGMLGGLNRLEEGYGRQQGEISQQKTGNQRQNLLTKQGNEASNRQMLEQRLAEAEEQEQMKRNEAQGGLSQLDLLEQNARSQFGSDSDSVLNWYANAQAQQAQMDALIQQLGLTGLANKQAQAFTPTAFTPSFASSDAMNSAYSALPNAQAGAGGQTGVADVATPTNLAALLKRSGLYA